MSLVGLIIDAVIIGISLLIVFSGRKRGAVKTILSLISGIASFLVACTFTPALSVYLQEKIFLDKLAQSIMNTIASIAQTGKDAAQNVIYDVSGLMQNSQFLSVLEKYGADPDKTAQTISGINDSTHAAVEKVSYAVAEPIAKTVSDITAFVILFVLALVVLKIITFVISTVFQLPVLRTMDQTLGLVFGIITAVFFVLVVAMIINSTAEILTNASPATFPENFPEKSFILRLLSKYNILSFITEKISF